MTLNLTSTMKAALAFAAEHGGTIKRYPGGYWGTAGNKVSRGSARQR